MQYLYANEENFFDEQELAQMEVEQDYLVDELIGKSGV